MTDHQAVDKFRQLRTEAAQARARAMRSQIAAGLTFCGLAESELRNGNSAHAHEMLERLQKLSETLRRHLNEPNHVPSSEIEKVDTELVQLESRTLALEERERG